MLRFEQRVSNQQTLELIQEINLTAGIPAVKTEEGRYCLNDLHRAAGGENKHRPGYWLNNQQTQDLIREIESRAGIPAVNTINGGANNGTYVCKQLVYSYAMWISAADYQDVR